MPKVELHIHLDGCMRPKTASMLLNINEDEAKNAMRVTGKCRDLNEYLEKFTLPIQSLQSVDTLYRVAKELALDLKSDNVVYAEVRFAPMQHVHENCTKEEVVEAVLNGFHAVDGIIIKTILCMMRNATVDENRSVIGLAELYKERGVVGLDLAGAEALYKTENFESLFMLAKKKGIPFTIHAGEADGPSSIASAIHFGAKRIGHGIRIIESMELLKKAKDNQIVFEVCPTSNIQTGVVDSYKNHPIKTMYEKGCIVTVNTDNRTVSGTTLTEEYQHLEDAFGFTLYDFIVMNKNAVDSSFADVETKEKIRKIIHKFEKSITH